MAKVRKKENLQEKGGETKESEINHRVILKVQKFRSGKGRRTGKRH